MAASPRRSALLAGTGGEINRQLLRLGLPDWIWRWKHIRKFLYLLSIRLCRIAWQKPASPAHWAAAHPAGACRASAGCRSATAICWPWRSRRRAKPEGGHECSRHIFSSAMAGGIGKGLGGFGLKAACINPVGTAHRDARRCGSHLLAAAGSSFKYVQRNLLNGEVSRAPLSGQRGRCDPQSECRRRPNASPTDLAWWVPLVGMNFEASFSGYFSDGMREKKITQRWPRSNVPPKDMRHRL